MLPSFITISFVCFFRQTLCQYPTLPRKVGGADWHQIQMTFGNQSFTFSNGTQAIFNAPPVGAAVTLTAWYNFDGVNIFCPTCIRQIYFGGNNMPTACSDMGSNNCCPSGSLLSTFTSDGTARDIKVDETLDYNCLNITPNNILGHVKAIPTNNPTPSPSLYPTSSPTSQTSAPTSKTSSPTTDPTASTMHPTEPSITPSAAPTSCNDDTLVNNNNVNYTQLLRNVKMVNNTINYINNNYVQCDITHMGICYVECTEYESCKDGLITVNDKNLSTLTVECTARSSCTSLNIDITNSIINTVAVYCGDEFSCFEMTLQIYNSFSVVDISIYCDHKYSCNNLWVNLRNGLLITNILCLQDYSCNNLVVIGNKLSNDIQINLYMYRFSDNVFIKYPYFNNMLIECSPSDDPKYIKYDTDKLLYESELLQLARQQYATNRLPCESIQLECNDDNSCDLVYTANHFNLTNLLKQTAYYDCQKVSIANIFDTECEGNCIQQTNSVGTNHNHSVTFDVNVVFKQNRFKKVCLSYFNTQNATMSSLQSINIIFDYVLSKLIKYNEMYPDYAAIIKITQSSHTVLRNGIDSLDCDSNSSLKLRTHLEVSSANDNSDDIEALFGDESMFVLNSRQKMEEYFVVPIDSIVVHTVIISDDEHKFDKLTALLVFVAVLIVIIIGLTIAVCIWKRAQEKNKEQLTIYISNPMIICVAIGQYDEHPTDSDFSNDISFPNLDGVRNDIINMTNIYKTVLGYKIHPYYQIDGNIKQRWTKVELIEFLSDKARDLELCIDEYDGLVVVVSAHGFKNSVVCSDYKRVDKDDIHRLFSVDHPVLRSLPRLFVYDCCDGQQGKHTVVRDEIHHKTDGDGNTDDIETTNEKYKGIKRSKRNKTKAIIDQSKNINIINPGTLKLIRSQHKLKLQNSVLWTKDELNPDFFLAIIHSANSNFQSYMNSDNGSYCIYKLSVKMIKNIKNNNNDKFLSEIFDEVQNELKEKQLIIATWNNGTGKIKFKKHEPMLPGNTSMKFAVHSHSEIYDNNDNENDNDDIETDIQLQKWIGDSGEKQIESQMSP